jgi:hypothetical protein
MAEAFYCEGYRMYDRYYWIAAFGLTWAALSTYWDWLFDYDNYYMHGFCIGIALLPLVGLGFDWFMILMRAMALSVSMGVWSEVWSAGEVVEMGRGALIVATLPILFL